MPNAALFKTVLDVLYYSGTCLALGRRLGGAGAILMLHHVRPPARGRGGFAPNAGLEITPGFLDQVLAMLKNRGFDLVNLDEAQARIRGGHARPFAAVTLDDGYRDNLVHAYPVFRRHACPFAIYVAPAIADGTCELWWRVLERAIAEADLLEVDLGGERLRLDCRGEAAKWRAWKRLYWPVRRLDQHVQRRWIRGFATACGMDPDRLCRDAAMGWDEIRGLAADPLCTIGAHTMRHFTLSALARTEAQAEMTLSADRIEAELGVRPRHLAFPYGDETSAGPREFALAAAAGFATAVTTRKGMIFPAHRDHLTALPRLSVSGEYQEPRYMKALLSGVPFAMFNRFRAVNVS